jgi:anaerobic selenocysteine-containing dehydrogenase
MCPQNCGIEVTVENGRPVSLKGSKEHPFNRGWLCVKGRASLDLLKSPHRLTSPMMRKNGRLVPVEWEEAFSFAVENLLRLRNQYGPQTVAIYQGEGIGHQEIKYYMKRFANVFGTPNFMGVGSICNFSRTLAETITLGGVTKPDIANSRFLIIWGGNPLSSHEPVPPGEITRFINRGGQLVVIDPRKTDLAKKANVHLAVKPGQDELLALNMLHVILKDDAWDKAFTNRWVHGFELFHQTVIEDRFSPENGEVRTGIAAGLVRQVASAYARTKPACISMGNGLEHHSTGINAMRLVAMMKVITGNVDVPGGDLFTPGPKLKDMTSPLPESDIPPVGSKEFPLFCQIRKEGRALSLPRAILERRPYPVTAMIIAGGNPSLEWPNSQQVRKALKRLEFLMVIDIVHSPDCEYAHVILPACTFLERDEHHVNVYHNLHDITLRRQVIEPIHGIPDQMIWVMLAQHLGLEKHFPWKTCKEGIDYLLGELGTTYDGFASGSGTYAYEKRQYRKYEKNGFNTPTGKVEIFSERLKASGYDPLPIREEVLHISEDLQHFPLHLTTGGNLLSYLHWQYRYLPKLRRLAPEPFCEIHPATALQYDIAEGDLSEVQTKHGSIQLKARVKDNIRPDTIHIPQGWQEANVNELTDAEDVDPVSGFPNLKSLRCRIRRPSLSPGTR